MYALTYARAELFFRTILEAFGYLWLVVEVSDYFFPNSAWVKEIRPHWWVFLLVGIVLGFYRARPKLSVKARIAGTDIDVAVRVGDLFKMAGDCIVGSNATFDTTMEDQTISPSSVQGQYTKRFAPSIYELDAQLTNALARVPVLRTIPRRDKGYGKHEEYQLGTVAPVTFNGKTAYFVAIATLNEHRVASTDPIKLLDSYPVIWDGIRSRGNFGIINCPILGSGFARVNLKRQELIIELIKSFVASTMEGKFCENFQIIVSKKDFVAGHVSLDEVGDFLAHQCKYAKTAMKNGEVQPAGIAIG